MKLSPVIISRLKSEVETRLYGRDVDEQAKVVGK
jgi:hypothetical protein